MLGGGRGTGLIEYEGGGKDRSDVNAADVTARYGSSSMCSQ